MFDFHMHSVISFDGKDLPDAMLRAAEERGLKEICFTDHLDYDPLATEQTMVFSTEDYNAAYDALDSTVLKLRRGNDSPFPHDGFSRCHRCHDRRRCSGN